MPPSSGVGSRTDDESRGSTVDGRWRCASFETGVQVGGILCARIDIRRRTMAIDSHGDVGRDEVEQADRRYRGEPRRTSRTTGQHRHLSVAAVTARSLLSVRECFAILHQINSVRHFLTRPALITLLRDLLLVN